MHKFHEVLKIVLVSAMLVGVAEAVLRVMAVPSYIFPKPTDILTAMADQSGSIMIAWEVTIFEALAGLVAAVLFSSILATATIFLPKVSARLINAVGVGLQSTPLLAIAPLLSLWFGQAFASKALASCIVCFFPLLTGWLAGVRSVDTDHLQLFENLRATRWQQAEYLLIPSALPFFFGGLRVAMPLSLLGAIVAEFVGASSGIGFEILENSYYVRTPAMFAYVIIAAISGLVLTSLTSIIERRTLFWYGDRRAR